MTTPQATARAGHRRIPFDYVFKFDLTGQPRRAHNTTVQVSTEGAFVAVAVGYGFVPRREPLRFGMSRPEDIGYTDLELQRATTAPRPIRALSDLPVTAASLPVLTLAARAAGPLPPANPPAAAPAASIAWPPRLSDLRLEHIANALRRAIREDAGRSLAAGRAQTPRQAAADVVEILTRGIRINPDLADTVLARPPDAPIPLSELAVLFEELAPDQRSVRFTYQLFDHGTGRAFQSDPILSTAGLGIDDGDRPFRRFAAPIVFQRLTSIRMEVHEVTEVPGELHVALHGYRELGAPGTPTEVRRSR